MANTVFNNKIIEAKAKDLLTTTLNTRSLVTVDSSLVAEAGMTKTINTYTYTGTAEEVGAGEGNTNRGSISYVGNDYTVKMVQQAFDYQDEDFMKDDTIVDNMLKGANQVMVNKMTEDFFTECAKASVAHTVGAFGYDGIVDAIAKLNIEDESKLFLVIPTGWKAELRKDEDYKSARMGEVIYNGQVGTICGIPVIATNALTDKAYVMTVEAVKLFMKKDVEVEQDRDADTRTNSVYLRTAYICALVDATKICKIALDA
jgi:HK97 family phage major capsid protein